jgi:hypothetical protein
MPRQRKSGKPEWQNYVALFSASFADSLLDEARRNQDDSE